MQERDLEVCMMVMGIVTCISKHSKERTPNILFRSNLAHPGSSEGGPEIECS